MGTPFFEFSLSKWALLFWTLQALLGTFFASLIQPDPINPLITLSPGDRTSYHLYEKPIMAKAHNKGRKRHSGKKQKKPVQKKPVRESWVDQLRFVPIQPEEWSEEDDDLPSTRILGRPAAIRSNPTRGMVRRG